jgi:Leucine-rich repeat (LRR) protein
MDKSGHIWDRLTVLNVSFNALRSLPACIGDATRLQQLYVANNHLESLPDSFGALPLVDLFLSENAIK